MINREYISSLNGFRHTDFGYFAGGGDGGTLVSPRVREGELCKAGEKSCGAGFTARPVRVVKYTNVKAQAHATAASIQSPRSAVIESHDGQLPIEQHNNLTALRWGSGKGRWDK